jgi:VCBS repeat-containing protein
VAEPAGGEAAHEATTASNCFALRPGDAAQLTEAGASILTAAIADATRLVGEFLSRPDADAILTQVFSGAAGRDGNGADVSSSLPASLGAIRVELLTNAEMYGLRGAFAAHGADGAPTIFLNRDWFESHADPSFLTRVLVEEYGHAIDAALNHSADTPGDEGQLFADIVLTGEVSEAQKQSALNDDDSATLSLDGVLLAVETNNTPVVSAMFETGYLGEIGTTFNATRGIYLFSSLGIERIAFEQDDTDNDGLFDTQSFDGTQGNDAAGRLKIYFSGQFVTAASTGVLSSVNGRDVLTLNAALNWREISQSSRMEIFGFTAQSGQSATITFNSATYNLTGGQNKQNSGNPDTNFGLQVYNSTYTLVSGADRSGNAANNVASALAELNSYVAALPSIGTITLTSNSVVEGNSLVYTVAMSSTTTYAITYSFSLSGSGVSGSDYSTITFSNGVTNNGDGTITVPTGVSSFTVTVATTDDAQIESTETLILTIGGLDTATGSITDNDTILPSATIADTNNASTGQVSVAENATHSGSFTVTAQNGLTKITVAGTDVTLAQLTAASTTAVTITGTNGVLTITGYNAATGVVSYSYDPTGASQSHSGERTDAFSIEVTDASSLTSTAQTLTILITDTEPVASADTGSVTEDAGTSTVTGNALTNDTLGADTLVTVKGVAAGATNTALTNNTGVGSAVSGTYGTLTMAADGSYTYALDNTRAATQALTAGQQASEVFTYTIVDADGDASFATVTITVTGAAEGPSNPSTIDPPAPPPVAPPAPRVASLEPISAPQLQTVIARTGGGGVETRAFADPPSATQTFLNGNDTGFRVSLVPPGPDGASLLSAGKQLVDVTIGTARGPQSFTIPEEAFLHSDANAIIKLTATTLDNRQLPGWLSFDPVTGTFVVDPPPGAGADVSVRVIAQDQFGAQASQEFKFLVQSDVRSEGSPGTPDDAALFKRQFRSFAAQLVEHSYDSPLDRSDRTDLQANLRRAS